MHLQFIILLSIFGFPDNNKVIDIRDYKWQYRLVCIESSDLGLAKVQLSKFSMMAKENEARKLKFLVKVNEEYYEGIDLKPIKYIKNFPTKKKQASFSIALIGLDGGQKNTWLEPIESIVIYDKIDAMPMRLGEMRTQ